MIQFLSLKIDRKINRMISNVVSWYTEMKQE